MEKIMACSYREACNKAYLASLCVKIVILSIIGMLGLFAFGIIVSEIVQIPQQPTQLTQLESRLNAYPGSKISVD
jgi:predicted PurR-regulated permease PerM